MNANEKNHSLFRLRDRYWLMYSTQIGPSVASAAGRTCKDLSARSTGASLHVANNLAEFHLLLTLSHLEVVRQLITP